MAWGQIGAAAIGGIASYFGAKSQNKANRAIAREQMAFQERMSSTAYQRSMDDMRKAGLNPILAYKQGGASSPGGAGIPAINVGEAATRGATSATSVTTQAKQAKAQIALTNTTERKTASEAKIASQNSYINELKTAIEADYLNSPGGQFLYELGLGSKDFNTTGAAAVTAAKAIRGIAPFARIGATTARKILPYAAGGAAISATVSSATQQRRNDLSDAVEAEYSRTRRQSNQRRR